MYNITGSKLFHHFSKIKKIIYNKLFIARSSIKYRLSIFFIIFSLVPLVVVAFISYSTFKKTMDHKVQEYSKLLIQQTAENIDITFGYYKDNMMQVLSNPEITSYLRKMLVDAKQTPPKENELNSTVLTTKLSSLVSTTQDIKAISFVSDKYYLQGTYYCNDDVLRGNSEYYKKVLKADRFVWFPTRDGTYGYQYDTNKVNVFSLANKVYNLNDMSMLNLIVVFDIKEQILSDICNKTSRNNFPLVSFVIDENGTIISHSDKKLLYKNINELFSKEDTQKILSNDTLSNGYATRYLNNKVYTNVAKLQMNNWKVVNVIEREYLYKEVNEAGNIITFLILLSIILSIITALFVAKGVSTPLKNMVSIMRQVIKGNFDARIEVDESKSTSDEIAVLQTSFNYMITKIQELIQRVYEEQNNKRISEIKALEGQINPHFLYNTLDMIKWTALFQKANKTAEMATLLSRLLHISLSKGKEVIDIEEEIEHVTCYIGIQKIRLNFTIDIRFNIQEDIKHCRTPKLILQPIVENAIIHGLENADDGRIDINCIQVDQMIKFEIIDNGCGMDMDEINSIKNKEKHTEKRFSGIGIDNVDERIRLICGDAYGIQIESEPAQGTKVMIWIPKIDGGD